MLDPGLTPIVGTANTQCSICLLYTSLASWNEADNSVGSHFEINVTALSGDFLSEIHVNNFFDLQLIFDSGKNLNVFCDINSFFDEEYFNENWYLSDKEENISLGIGRESNIIQSTYS